MAGAGGIAALKKNISLSIHNPTHAEAQEHEPPPEVCPVPTPSVAEIEAAFERDLKATEKRESFKRNLSLSVQNATHDATVAGEEPSVHPVATPSAAEVEEALAKEIGK